MFIYDCKVEFQAPVLSSPQTQTNIGCTTEKYRSSKDTDEIANSADPDQTAPEGVV